jgi:hypothetical protein
VIEDVSCMRRHAVRITLFKFPIQYAIHLRSPRMTRPIRPTAASKLEALDSVFVQVSISGLPTLCVQPAIEVSYRILRQC